MIGKTLAHYTILEKLGQGGMGEVYRARDTKLDREVALKLLPPELSSEPERLARFRREAKVLASLNHASIASIHGLEEDGGQLFLVMELAEGEDLSKRLARGACSVDETVQVARQLAEGLEQAHERGVVHRDLKPANVMLSSSGAVKILDFGLARAYAGESAEEGELANSPTITAAMTQAGTILGTAAYMSPEQARGKEVDRRADIWAFGVILYEMLRGQQLFEGETISDTLAGVLKTDPDLDVLPDDTPIALRWLIERCLQKQPSARLRDIGEARILLESDLDRLPTLSQLGTGAVVSERPRWVIPSLLAVAVVAALVGAWLSRVISPGAPPQRVVHASLIPPDDNEISLQNGGHLALSPDGSRLAFVAVDSTGTEHLWVRRVDSPAAHQLSGTEDASYPFWSSDGSKIGFFTPGKMRKIDAAGGVATTICDASSGRGGSWTPDGRILFAPSPREAIHVVAAAGGEPLALTRIDSLGFSHRWPEILPDGKHFLYTVRGEVASVRWTSLSEPDSFRQVGEMLEGRCAAGYLTFGRDGALWARPFDPDHGEFRGEEMLLAETVVSSDNFAGAAYSVADDGTLVYAGGTQGHETTVGVYDGEGVLQDQFPVDAAYADDPNLSPDGRYLALAITSTEGSEESDIWIRDLQRKTLSRFTTGENVDDPVWAPSQDRILYSQEGDLRVRSTVGAREILLEFPQEDDALPQDWSRDGRQAVFSLPGEGRSIWLLSMEEGAEPELLVSDVHFNVHPTFSPDGKWITYMSVETGDPRIYLRELGKDGGTWQVSSIFGIQPRFTQNGQRILFVGEGGLWSVDLRWTEHGPEFGEERFFAEIPIREGRYLSHQWTISAKGDRIVAFIDPHQRRGERKPLELVVGWPHLLASEQSR